MVHFTDPSAPDHQCNKNSRSEDKEEAVEVVDVVNEEKKDELQHRINHERAHVEIRNLIMLILLPKKLHFDGNHQAAFIRAAVSRVN